MPTYELIFLLRKAETPQIKAIMKRTAGYIFQIDGVLRKMENLGLQRTPYKLRGPDGTTHTECHYLTYLLDTSVLQLKDLKDKLSRDNEILRHKLFFIEDKLDLKPKKVDKTCYAYLDMLDAPERPVVQEMVRISKRKKKNRFRESIPKNDPLRF